MSNNIESKPGASGFFPNARPEIKGRRGRNIDDIVGPRNAPEKKEELIGRTKEDVKVEIPDAIKDYSRIRKAVDQSPEIDNSAKIADLRKRISEGSYKVDYEALADKILTSEF